MNGTVAHQNQGIPLLNLKTVFVNLLSLYLPDILRNWNQLSIADKNTAGIIKLHQVGISAVEYLQNTEGSISHLPYLTDRQRLHNGLHTLLQSRAV